MVPMIVNFHQYRADIKRSVLTWLESIDVSDHPFDYAWLVYALSCDGVEHNTLFDKYLTSLVSWSNSRDAWKYDRNLGALSLLSYFLKIKGVSGWNELSGRIVSRLEPLIEKTARKLAKHSILNTPELFFAVIIGNKENFEEKFVEKLKGLAIKRVKMGRILRRVFYAASLYELNSGDLVEIDLPKGVSIPEDIIALVWFTERYGLEEKLAVWQMFSKVKDALILDPAVTIDESGNLIHLSPITIAMLYEALVYETNLPDPEMLFDFYPLHPRVREISESLFREREYINAVFEATKALEDYIKEKTGLSGKIQTVLGKLRGRDPILKFSDLLTDSQRTEHSGLVRLLEGVFLAFRHPKGHKPKDKIEITPYEALSQLITISYLMDRFEKVKIKR